MVAARFEDPVSPHSLRDATRPRKTASVHGGAAGEPEIDKLYQLLEDVGYPSEAIDWLRMHRLSVIFALATLAWLPIVMILWALAGFNS